MFLCTCLFKPSATSDDESVGKFDIVLRDLGKSKSSRDNGDCDTEEEEKSKSSRENNNNKIKEEEESAKSSRENDDNKIKEEEEEEEDSAKSSRENEDCKIEEEEEESAKSSRENNDNKIKEEEEDSAKSSRENEDCKIEEEEEIAKSSRENNDNKIEEEEEEESAKSSRENEDCKIEEEERPTTSQETANWNIEGEEPNWITANARFNNNLDNLLEEAEKILPGIGKMFVDRNINCLLLHSVNYMARPGAFYYKKERFIEFAVRYGNKDKLAFDKDGKPIFLRPIPKHGEARHKFLQKDEMVRELFKKYESFEVNYVDDPPLYLAIIMELKNVIEFLLRVGADPNSADNKKSTPLHLIGADDVGLMEHFLDTCENIETPVQVNGQDSEDKTPLHIALHDTLHDIKDVFLVALLVHNLLRAEYEMCRSEAIMIFEAFVECRCFVMTESLVERLSTEQYFSIEVQRIRMSESQSLYDLMNLLIDEVARQFNYKDFKFTLRTDGVMSRYELTTIVCAILLSILRRQTSDRRFISH